MKFGDIDEMVPEGGCLMFVQYMNEQWRILGFDTKEIAQLNRKSYCIPEVRATIILDVCDRMERVIISLINGVQG